MTRSDDYSSPTRIDRIGSEHSEVFLRCYFPDQHLDALLGLEERLQRKLKQAAAAIGVGTVLPGFAAREINFTETRDEIARLQREEADLFEQTGLSALSGEEYRRTLAREISDPTMRSMVLGLPWGAGTSFIRTGAAQPGMVFCARIADHTKPWFRYVPLDSGFHVQRDSDGNPIVIDDTLTCLAHADPGGTSVPSLFAESGYEELYDAAFDVWSIAKSHIHEAWMFNADPANLTAQIPRVMRDAAELVRAGGSHLGDRQDDLVERLEAPYSPRIQRAVRDALSEDISGRDKVNRLLALADHLGLAKQPSPEPLPEITTEDIHLICWTAVVPDV